MNSKFFLVLFLSLFSAGLCAQTQIQDLRIIAPIPGQQISAAYLLLKNTASVPVELVSIESEGAEKIEIHTHEMNNGMMTMIKLDSLLVEAGSQAEFMRGGLHLMVFSPDAQMLESGVFAMTFNFADGSAIQAEARVEQLMPMPMNHENHQQH